MVDKWTTRRRWLGLAVIGLVLLIFVGDRIINGRRGENYHQELTREFAAITPLPNASVVHTADNFSAWNSHKGLVGATYKTNIPYSGIQDFYNRELESRGWYLTEDRPLRDWGKDLGGRAQTYCKGVFAASLQYSGAKSDYGWTYALDLSWGLYSCQ